MRRSPAVAGQFYYADPARLSQQVAQYTNNLSRREDAIGIVVPHAGLIFSGPVAGAVYSAINFPMTFLMLGPNHTGLGPQISIMDAGEWEIPTGVIQIDRKLSSRILLNAPGVSRDSQAHIFEHSLEVQLPFMTFFSKEIHIVPIAIRSASYSECITLSETIAQAVKGVDYPVTILASSDMSHNVSDKTARLKDKRAIDRMLDIDSEGLYDSVIHEKISMCGYLSVTIMLAASKLLGAKTAQLVKYMTSAEVNSDYDNVVGYAGMILARK